MVNHLLGEGAINIQPSKTVSEIFSIKDFYVNIAIARRITSARTCHRLSASIDLPSKNSRIRVVIEHCAQSFGVDHAPRSPARNRAMPASHTGPLKSPSLSRRRSARVVTTSIRRTSPTQEKARQMTGRRS